MKASSIKRVYDNQNRLIYELRGIDEETIIRYDDNGNKVYEKQWKSRTGEIWCEQFLEYDIRGNLVHFKDSENSNEYWVKYDNCNRPIKQTWYTGEATIFEYDERGNVVKTFNEKGELEAEFINEYL